MNFAHVLCFALCVRLVRRSYHPLAVFLRNFLARTNTASTAADRHFARLTGRLFTRAVALCRTDYIIRAAVAVLKHPLRASSRRQLTRSWSMRAPSHRALDSHSNSLDIQVREHEKLALSETAQLSLDASSTIVVL